MGLDASDLAGGSSVPTGAQSSTAGSTSWPGNGAGILDVGPANVAGVGPTTAAVDHIHKGVHSVNGLFGDVTITPSLYTVANVAALGALASAAIPEGSWAYVATYKAWFALVASTQAASTNVRVAASGKAGFLWVRVQESTVWWSVATWNINPATGSDEADGSGATPIKTWAELGRRTRNRALPGTETASFAVNLLADTPDTDFVQLHFDNNARTAGTVVTINGTVTPVAVGIIASAVAKNAAANQPNTITVAGFNWATHVGQIIRLVGTNTTTAVVTADLGANTCRLSEQNVNGAVGAGFTAGQTVEIIVGPKIPGTTLTGIRSQIIVNDCLFNPAASVSIKCSLDATSTILTRCEVRGNATGSFFGPMNCTGSAFVGRSFNFGMGLAGVATEFVNCPVVFLSGANMPTGSNGEHHVTSIGLQASSISLDINNFLDLIGDFHAFDLPSGVAGIGCQGGSFVRFAAAYYGSGNNANSAGLAMPYNARSIYTTVPVMDAAKGLYYDGALTLTGGTALPFAGGLGVGLPLVPATMTAFPGAVQSAKLNAMINT